MNIVVVFQQLSRSRASSETIMEQATRFHSSADQRSASHVAVVGGEGEGGGARASSTVTEEQREGEVMVASAGYSLRDTVDGAGQGRRDPVNPYVHIADACNIVLLALVTSFVCIFTWAWVDAFRKEKYNQAIGLVTILFFGTIVFTFGYRRRLAAISRLEQEQVQMQMDQIDMMGEMVRRRPNGVPPHARKEYDFFIFEGTDAATLIVEEAKEPPPRQEPPPPLPQQLSPPAPAAGACMPTVSLNQLVIASLSDLEAGVVEGTHYGPEDTDPGESRPGSIPYGPENLSAFARGADVVPYGSNSRGAPDDCDTSEGFATPEVRGNPAESAPDCSADVESAVSRGAGDSRVGSGVSTRDVLSVAREMVARAAISSERSDDTSTIDTGANSMSASISDDSTSGMSPSRAELGMDEIGADRPEQERDDAASRTRVSTPVSEAMVNPRGHLEERKEEQPTSQQRVQDGTPRPGPNHEPQQRQSQEQTRARHTEGETAVFFGPEPECLQQHKREREGRWGRKPATFAWLSSELTDCSVCLEMYRVGDRICRLPCGHSFHAACIDIWLDQQHVCPQCRHDLLPQRGDEQVLQHDDRSPSHPDTVTSADFNPAPLSSLFRSPLGSLPLPDAMMILPTRSTPNAGGPVGRRSSGSLSSPSPAFIRRTGGGFTTRLAIGTSGAPSPLRTSTLFPLRRSQEFLLGGVGGGGGGARARGTPASSSTVGAFIGTPRFNHSMFLSGSNSPSIGSNSSSIGRCSTASSHPPLPPQLMAGAPRTAAENPRESRRSSGRTWSGLFALQNGNFGGSPTAHNQVQSTSTRGRAPARGRAPTPGRPQRQRSQRQFSPGVRRQQQQFAEASPRQEQSSPLGFYRQEPPPLALPQRRTPSLTSSRHGQQSGTFHGPVAHNVGAVMIAPGVVTTTSGDFVVVSGHGNGNVGGIPTGNPHRRLRLPNLSRRPRSSSCDIISSPGLCVLGNASPSSPTPKSIRGGGGIHWGTPLRTRGRNSAAQTNNKGWPAARAAQVRMTSWDDGDEFAGSAYSGITARRRRGSDDWGARDWGRSRSSVEPPPTGTEAEHPSVAASVGTDPALSTVVLGGGAPPPVPPTIQNQESEDNMSTATEEHEHFGQTMIYC